MAKTCPLPALPSKPSHPPLPGLFSSWRSTRLLPPRLSMPCLGCWNHDTISFFARTPRVFLLFVSAPHTASRVAILGRPGPEGGLAGGCRAGGRSAAPSFPLVVRLFRNPSCCVSSLLDQEISPLASCIGRLLATGSARRGHHLGGAFHAARWPASHVALSSVDADEWTVYPIWPRLV